MTASAKNKYFFFEKDLRSTPKKERKKKKMKKKTVLGGVFGLLLVFYWGWYVTQKRYETEEKLFDENESAKGLIAAQKWRKACMGTDVEHRQYKDTETIIECFREASYLFANMVRFNTKYGLPFLTFGEQECSGKADEKTWHVLVVCGQHGRELVTSEICLDLLYELMYSRGEGVVWHIIPVMNKVGRTQAENVQKNGCWRGNANGVDLNRNFPSWVSDEYRAKVRERIERNLQDTNPGPFPGSEIETQAIMQILTDDEIRVDMVVNVHSGTETVGIPYDCCAQDRHPLYHQMVSAAQAAKRPMYEDPGEADEEARQKIRRWLENLSVGQASHRTILYESIGSLVDYAVGVARVPVGYTIEVYGVEEPIAKLLAGDDATEGEICFAQFNPTSGESLDRVVRTWSRYLCDLGYVWEQIIKN